MRLAVVRTQVPFVHGGAERHAANLCAALRRHGHEAVEVAIPFRWYPGGTLVDHVMAAKLIDLERFEGAPIDATVGLKFPAWLARHPNRLFWILHQHRQAYDMWDSGHSDLLHEPDGAAIRGLIRAEDTAALGAPDTAVFANSGNVAGRLVRYLGLSATPLYHPPPNAEALRPGAAGDYVLAPGRINPAKRQALMVEALAETTGPVRLVIAGPADDAAYLDTLRTRARDLGVDDRIEWTGPIDDATMVRLYAGARAVAYTPIDEDYGYVTLEAMLAAKPLIVTTDAGGPLEFVRDGVEGLVVAPEAAALARAFERLADDPEGAERMGEAGHARYASMAISWDTVVERLVDAAAGKALSPAETVPAAPAPIPTIDAPLPTTTAPAAIEATIPKAEIPEADTAPATPAREEAVETVVPVPSVPAEAEVADTMVPPHSGETTAPLPVNAAPPVDLDAIRARLAPPVPAKTPFPDIAALMGAHRFGTFVTPGEAEDTGAAAYFQTHWRRYLATLAIVETETPKCVLDVGLFPPFLFQALLAHAFPEATLDGVWEGPEPFVQRVRAASAAGRDFTVSLRPANVERDPWPYPDESHDLVLAMEILEHLAIDPLHFATEAARVLAPGGRLVLTTPNVTSHRGVAKMLRGASPYSFGLFVPTGGVYGRHNREWTPREVADLAEAAGFETETLATADVYDDHIDVEAAALLAARDDDFSLRGETILYVGRRPARLPADTPPEGLYHGDPGAMYAGLRLLHHDKRTGRATLRLENRSRRWWQPLGEGAVSLYLAWHGPDGALGHAHAHPALAGPLGPGEGAEVTLQLDSAPAPETGTLIVETTTPAGLVSGTGRGARLRLPCSEAAFLRLVGGRAFS